MQSSQVRNVDLPSSAETKRDVPAWTQDPKIFPLDWFSVSRPNIIRQTKEYVSELSKWRNCPKIKTLSKLKAVLKRIMMFLHTHTSYIDGKSLLECDIEEDLITLVSLYMDMELRVLLIKKSAASGTTPSNTTGPASGSDIDTARNDKLVADRISYWLYTVLKGHEHRMDALLSTTVFTRHTRPVLDPIFRKILSEMSDGPFSNVNYVRHMLAYKTWRERALVADDAPSEELNSRVQQHLVPRDYVFPPPLLRCLGKGDNARDHARPHNVNLADACRNFMRFCREMPAAAAEQINFGSIPLLDDDMLGDEENEVNKLMNMISERKQRKAGSPSLSPKRNFQQVHAFIDLTLPKSRMKSISSRDIPSTAAPDVIDLTEEDEKPVKTSRTSAALETPVAASPRTAPAVQRISASKKVLPPQDCSYALAPSAAQVETRRFTAFLDQDIILVNISCMCPQRRQRECQCQDKKVGYHKEKKALKTSITERNYEKDTTFVGRCFQFSIGNQYPYPSEDDVDTEIGNSPDQMKLEMRPSAAVTCNTNEDEDESRDETAEFCDSLFSASLNHCDCDGCKPRDTNVSQYENRTCTSAESRVESANELSDINVQCKQKPLVTCTQRVSHPTSVADMYAMEKTSPIVLQSQPSTSGSEDENPLEHFSETLDKRKINLSENNKILENNLIQSEKSLSNNSRNDIRKIKLPVVETVTDIRPDKTGLSIRSEDVFTASTNITTRIYEEIANNAVSLHKSEDKFTESTNITATVTSPNESVSPGKTSLINVEDLTESTNVTAATTIFDRSTIQIPKSAEKISITNAQYETTLHVSDTKTELENFEYFTENTNVTTGSTILDKSMLQEPKTSEKISLSNAQSKTLLQMSNTRTEIEKLCSEISELGCSVLPDIDNITENDEKIVSDVNEISAETLDSVRKPMYEPEPDLKTVNISEENSESFPESLELTQYVSTRHVETPVNTDFEELSDSHVIKKYNTEEDITNKIELSHTECINSTNSAQIDFVEKLTPEMEIVIESEVIVKSVSDTTVSFPVLNTISGNHLEYENTIPSNTQHPFIEPETKELHTFLVKTDNHIEHEELRTGQVETDVNIEHQELHTVPVETDVLTEQEKIHTVLVETDVNIEQQELRTVPIETDVNIEPEEIHRVQAETDVNIEQQELYTVPVETDVHIEQEELHTVQVESETNIEQQELHTVQVETDINIEQQELLSVQRETDVNIEQQELYTVPVKTDVHIEQEELHTVQVESETNIEQQELHTVQVETDVNIEQQELYTVPVETDVHIEQEELHTVEVESEDNIEQQELHTVQVDTEVNIEQQELHTVPIETDVHIEHEELHTVQVESEDNIEQQDLHSVPVETDVYIEEEDLHTVQVESDVNVEQQELYAIPHETDCHTEQEKKHTIQVETDVNIELQELHTVPVEKDVHIEQEQEELHTVPVEIKNIEQHELPIVSVEKDVHIEQEELHTVQVENEVNIEQELHSVPVETDVYIEPEELHIVQVETDVNIEQQELRTVPGETKVYIEQEALHTVQVETDVNIEQQELHTVPGETEVYIEQEALHTVQVETDVNIEQQELHTVPVETEVYIEQEALHTVQVETDVNIEQQELHTVPVETEVYIEQEALHTVQVETDVNIEQQELHTVPVETEVYIEQEVLHTVQVETDVNIEQQELHTVSVETDVHIEQEKLHTVPVETDVHIEQEELHTVEVETDTNIEQPKLLTVQVETDVNIYQQQLHTVQIESNSNIEQQELYTVPLETDVHIGQEKLHTVPAETDVNIEEQEFRTLPIETDVHIKPEEVHSVQAETETNNEEQELHTVPVETDVYIEQEELHAVQVETDVNIEEQELHTVPIDVHIKPEDIHRVQAETDTNIEQELLTVAEEDLHTVSIGTDVIVEQELHTIPMETDVLVDQELHTIPMETSVVVEPELHTVPIEKDVCVEQELHTDPIEKDDCTNLSNAEYKVINIRKQILSLVTGTLEKGITIDSKNDTVNGQNLSPRKRRKRKIEVVTDESSNENELEVSLYEKNCQKINDGNNDVLGTSRRRKSRSLDETVINTEIGPKLELTKAITSKYDTVPEITISATCKKNTLSTNNFKMSNLTSEIFTDNSKINDEKPKRRRKQNFKNVREDKTVLTTTKVDKSASTAQTGDKKLYIVCKNLTQSEIELLRQNRKGSLPENNVKLSTAEEDENKIKPRKKNQMICNLTSNNIIEGIESQQTKLTEKEKQIKTNLNSKQKNNLIYNSNETALNKNSEEITFQLDITSKEKKKQSKINIKSRRNSQPAENKIVYKTTEDHIANSPIKETKEIIPDRTVRRSRGRPPKIVANKLKFFSENFNLQNLNSNVKFLEPDKNFIEKDNSVQEVNKPFNLEVIEEDMPLAYRMSQTASQKRNSLKSLKLDNLSEVENKFEKSIDELPLSTRKQKLTSSQSPKNSKHSVFMKFDKKSKINHSKHIENWNKIHREPITKSKLFRNKLEQFKFQPKNKDKLLENIAIQEEEDTFSLKKFNTGSNCKKSIKTYSNTKILKTPELFSVPDIIQTTRKPKKSIRFSDEVTIINIGPRNYLETDFDNSDIPVITKSVLQDQQLRTTKAISDNKNAEISLSSAEKIKIKKSRKVSGKSLLLNTINTNVNNKCIKTPAIADTNIINAVQLIEDTEDKSKNDDIVIEVIITESQDISTDESENANISTENIITPATPDTIQLCANNPEFVEEITDNLSPEEKFNENTKIEKENIKSSKIVTSNCNKLFTEANKVNIETCIEPATFNSHVCLMPKKLLSKKAREKLLVAEIKNLSEDKIQEKLDPFTETETSETKNILSHSQFQENLSPDNDMQEFPASPSVDNKTADTVNNLLPESSVSIEQETSINKQEEITFESSETNPTDEKDSSLTEISSLSSVEFQDTASENTGVGISKSVEFHLNENLEKKNNECTSKENSEDSDQSTKIRKSKFPKLKLKMNNKNNLFFSSKVRNNIRSVPKLKSQFSKKKKNKLQLQLNRSNSKTTKTLLSKVGKFKQSREKKSTKRTKSINKTESVVKSIELCSNSSFQVEECKNVVQIADEQHSLKSTETSNSIVNVVDPFEQISINNISKENLKLYSDSVIITEPVELTENIPLVTEEDKQNITEDITEKPCNKIYKKHFDFNSDKDNASNSELVKDTSAESSDTVEPAIDKEDKNDHQIDSQITVSKQAKYHHSIAEIVQLNEQTTPMENNCSISDTVINDSSNNNEINKVAQENKVNTVDPSGIKTLIQVANKNNVDTVEHQIDNMLNISTPNQVIDENTLEETKEKTVIVEENITGHQKRDVFITVPDSSSIPIVEETVVKEMIVEETNIATTTDDTEHSNEIIDNLKEDIVLEEQATEDSKDDKISEERTLQNTIEEMQKIIENKKIILEERTAEIIEISDEIYELYTESVNEEKGQQLIESFAPSVEMFLNMEVGFESCTFSQKKPIEGEHAKEGCVKCSVNGKHKNNKQVTVRGIHQYQQNNVNEFLEENANIPAISCCQAVESFEPNPCNLTAKVDSVKVSTNNNPALDNYNLCILADIAMNSVHLNTKTENNVMEVIRERSNEITNQNPIRKDERCFFITFPEKMPDSNKPATSLSIINSNNEEMSVNVQKLAGGLNPKGILLENKIQALTERAKNGTRINGENLDELCKSLENMCDLEINTLTKTAKSDCQNNILPEPNITIDIPNTALLHLTPDDDDFMIRNEPFSLQTPTLQSLPVETAPKAPPKENKADIDTTEVVKNVCNVIESVTNNQKISSENENSDCNITKEEQETKIKFKKGRVKSKSSNNQSSETSYLLNKYKSNLDSNKNTELSNQQTTSNNKNVPSPPSYIRSTRPMRMVTTRKRNVNVLDNSCPPNEPVKKVSVSEKMFDKLLEEHRKELSETKLKVEVKEEISIEPTTENSCMIKDTPMPVLDDNVPETNIITTPITQTEELNIPLPVLQYQISETELRNEKITSNIESTNLDLPIVHIEESQKEHNSKGNILIEAVQNSSLANDEHPVNEKLSENILISSEVEKSVEISEENSLNEKETIKEIIMSHDMEVNTPAKAQINKDRDEQIMEKEVSNTIDRNASAIEVVQDWFNRVDKNKAQTEPYAEITSYQTIEECNFFEDSSSIENSPNVRKTDEKVFNEHQTPDSGIAFDEDSVQKDKSLDSQTPVPENLSDGEIFCMPETEPVTMKTYFSNLSGVETENVHEQDEITDLQTEKPKISSAVNNMKLKVSIALSRIQDILPMIAKNKINSPERKIKKRKECATDFDKGMKRKYCSVEEEMVLNPIAVQDFNKTLLKDYKIKRRKHSIDENMVQECIVEEVVSPAPSQKDVPSAVRTKGSVKEYPDYLFGITESPYPSDISLTEEPTFNEEEGIDLCNDYPCYDSFEVLQEQQSLQKDYNVVDDNPKDVQQGLQAAYCVVDSQYLPLSEYMNDGDYILIDNKIFNDKRMVPVNMHQVQPEFKPHTEEVKRSEFDDSEKEDSLSETVDEIIKNINLFPEQSTSEVKVISMDQATSEVQVVSTSEVKVISMDQATSEVQVVITHRSSQYNSKIPDVKPVKPVKPSHSRNITEQNRQSSTSSKAHKDWLKNETLLNLIKTANTIYSKKY